MLRTEVADREAAGGPGGRGGRSGRGVLIRPLRDFLATEAAGGLLVVAAAIGGLLWANSPWKFWYHEFWAATLSIDIAGHSLSMDLRHWVNDGLMTLFFFVVGLEIKRELVEGELREPRRAALPVVAAFGGMVVPVVLFAVVNSAGPGARGWAIPMATDIALALGVLALLGSRAHPALKLFLLALAIVDDIGAIVVIAIFFSDSLNGRMLGVSAGLIGVIATARRLGLRPVGAYIVLGVGLWFTIHEAGVHATLAGVILGLLAPTKPFVPVELVDEAVLADVSTVTATRETVRMARDSVSVVEWLEHHLHPWTSFLIVPLFAFANAGITLDLPSVRTALTSPVTLGVVLGLVVGKTVGVTAAAWLAVRLNIAVLPDGLTWRSIVGVAALAGMGFTVSLFVAGLAFVDPVLEGQAKIGIVVASVVAGVLGAVLVGRSSPPSAAAVVGGGGRESNPPNGDHPFHSL